MNGRLDWIVTGLDSKDSNPGLTGGKGYNLLRLKKAGFNVPKFFIISTSAFDEFMEANSPLVSELYGQGAGAMDKIRGLSLPKEIRESIQNSYGLLFGSDRVAVRSSATVEDMDSESMAGQFKTVLSVDRESIIEAVKAVYASLFSAADPSKSPKMAVVVQEMIRPQKAGIAFVDRKKVIMNSVLGQGELLVSNRESGDVYVVGDDGSHSARIAIQSRMSSDGNEVSEIPPEIMAKQKLAAFEMDEIAETARRIYSSFGSPQDIEWCIDRGRLLILQARPVTKEVDADISESDGAIPISRGRAAGAAWFDSANMPDSDVILATTYIEMQDFDRVLADRHVKGLITEFGGMLSHEGILAREKGIPYMAGIRSPRKAFEGVKNILMDTEKMSIIADGKEILNAKAESYSWLNKDLTGLTVLPLGTQNGQFGTVVRVTGKFVVVYGEVKSRDDADALIKAVDTDGTEHAKMLVCDAKDRTPALIYKYAINVINNLRAIKDSTALMMDAIGAFDSSSLKHEYTKAKALCMDMYGRSVRDYARSKKDDGWLGAAMKSAVEAYGCYKGIRMMVNYFDYALGVFISKSEGRLITDAELYGLMPAYKERFPHVRETADLLEGILDEIDGAVHANSTGEDSIGVIFNRLYEEAGKTLGSGKLNSILLAVD